MKPISESNARITVDCDRGVLYSASLGVLLESNFCPDAYRWPDQVGEFISVKLVDGDKTIEEIQIPIQRWVDKWQRSRKD